MIVVSMTSWVKRIKNVKPVVENVMKNTVQPDRLYLSLSIEEFPNKELDLPKDLVDYFNSDDRLIINWVEGENTKSMKKVFPVLKYLEDDDLILNIDDDMSIPSNFIKCRLDEYRKYGMAISGSNNPKCHHKTYDGGKMNFWICCGASIFPKKYLNNWEKIINDDIIRTYNDDFTYTLIAWLNGYLFKPCEQISTHSGVSESKISKFNDVDGMGRNHVYKTDTIVYDLFNKASMKLFGKKISDSFNQFRGYDVIVSLTSYPDRFLDESIYDCLNTIVGQKTDIRYKIVFSIYKNDIEKMPNKLVEYCIDNNIEILKCDDDIKGHKKYYYVSLKYKNTPIITLDDDIIYSKYIVNSLYNSYKNNPNVISSVWVRRIKLSNGKISSYKEWDDGYKIDDISFYNSFGSGAGTLFPPEMFDIKLDINDIKKYINQDEFFLLKNSMERGIPVKFVPYLYDEKKYDNTYCSKICGYILGSTKTYHIDTALCKVNNQNNKLDDDIKSLLKNINIESIEKKLYNKHDAVLVYHKNGMDSNEMTCGEHLEIEYVIASLKKYCTSWLGRIFVVGSEPPEQIKKDVIHFPCDNPYTHCKDANIVYKIHMICKDITDLSDDFIVVSDDQIVTRNTVWDDFEPRVWEDFTKFNDNDWKKYCVEKGFWEECLYNTLRKFKTRYAFVPHIWSPMNKHKFMDLCEKYDYTKDIGCIVFSFYYNFINQPYKKNYDNTYIRNASRFKTFLRNKTTHIGWVDDVFKMKEFRDFLDEIVGFKDSCENDMQTTSTKLKFDSKSTIQKLREGIKNGTIVKEIQPDGTHIWKKIRK